MFEKAQSLYIRVAQITSDRVNLPNKNADDAIFSNSVQSVLQLVFATMGAIAVLVIMLAALQYVTANGDSQRISKAKDAIIYALIGLAVAVLSFAIVSFVLNGIFG